MVSICASSGRGDRRIRCHTIFIVVTKAAIEVAKPKELAHDFRNRCWVAVLYSATKSVGLDLRDRSSQDVRTSI